MLYVHLKIHVFINIYRALIYVFILFGHVYTPLIDIQKVYKQYNMYKIQYFVIYYMLYIIQAIFDGHDAAGTLKLWKSGIELSVPSSSSSTTTDSSSPSNATVETKLENPLIVIANYLFDTLCHDAFQVHPYTTTNITNATSNTADNNSNTASATTDNNTATISSTDTNTNTKVGIMTECLISVGSKQEEEADALHPDIITRLENEYKYIPIDPTSYYTTDTHTATTTINSNTNNNTTNTDSNTTNGSINGSSTGTQKGHNYDLHLNRILTWYQDRYKNESEGASIMFPIGALRVLERLSGLSRERGELVYIYLIYHIILYKKTTRLRILNNHMYNIDISNTTLQ